MIVLRGAPYEMGVEQGRILGERIRAAIAIAAGFSGWRTLVEDSAAARITACLGSRGQQELSGIAEAAGIARNDLLALNHFLYEAIRGGVHFAICAEANGSFGMLHGANNDLALGDALRDALGRAVFARYPTDAIASVTLGVPGQAGCQSGINARGISITSTRLMDLNTPSVPVKRFHTILVQEMLETAADIDAARALYRDEPGDTPYTILLADAGADRLCHIEYDMVLQKILPWAPDVIAANHRLMRTVPGEAPSQSRERTARLRELLGGDVPQPTSPLAAMRVLRDTNASADAPGSGICGADNEVSVLFQPAARSLWVTTGSRSPAARDAFCQLDLGELLPGFPRVEEQPGCYQQPGCLDAVRQPAITSRAACVESLPLIDAVPEVAAGSRLVAESQVDPVGDVFLIEHRFKDRPMMPLVVMVEMLAEAAALLAGPNRRVLGVRDVEIVNGLRFQSDDVQAVRIEAVAAGAEINCLLTCDVRNRRGDVLLKDKPHLRGVVELADAEASPSGPDASTVAPPPTDPTRWVRCFYTENIVIHHGPVFRCLRALTIDDEYSWGEIVPLPISRICGVRTGDGWLSNPTMLDACLYACGSTLWLKNRGIIAVPDGIERLRFGRLPRPNEKCLVTMRDRGRNGNRTAYDFTAIGDDGEVIVDVLGYKNLIVAEEPARPSVQIAE